MGLVWELHDPTHRLLWQYINAQTSPRLVLGDWDLLMPYQETRFVNTT